MAPSKPSSKGKSRPASKAGGASKKQHAKASAAGPQGISKRKAKSMALAKPGGAQKTKSRLDSNGKKKKRVYTEAELDIPKLNGIVPAGIAKPKGQKKGKVFVDDQESMMAIMSVVNAEKEGAVESKIMRARQLEEVREARRKEAEKKSEEKERAFEEKKQSLKKKKRHSEGVVADEESEGKKGKDKAKGRKRVSFG